MTDPPAPTLPAYQRSFVGVGYDLLNALLWLPGGSDRLRRDLVAHLDVRAGQRVLELGCGTGLVTRHLVEAGADVTAVDSAATMLAGARRRAPAAHLVVADLTGDVPVEGQFDAVVLSLVLHELAQPERVDLLRRAAGWLAPDGTVGILEWAVPTGRVGAAVWRRVVRTIEPQVAHDVLDGAIDTALTDAGLTLRARHPVAAGRAQVLLATG